MPKALRAILQRLELSFSLHTSDRGTAEALALEMSAGQLRLCRALRQAAGPMTADLDGLVRHYMTSFRENREEDSIALGELLIRK